MRLDFLREKIEERRQKGNLRQLRESQHLLDFLSNDYLGLSRNPTLAANIHTKCISENLLNGGTGSRLLSGNHLWYTTTEAYLRGVLKAEAVLIFNSGYAANMALVSAVAQSGDTIFYDLLSHVCLKEGAWLSKAETSAFRHNDLEDLEAKLKRAKGRCFVLTETIFSMDGDVAPIEDLIGLCERYGAYLIVDEAHSTGVMGASGSGMLVYEGWQDRVFGRVYTFGKAMGVHGACVAGSQVLIDYLINFGRPLIYTTSLPPHSVVSINASFEYLSVNMSLQDQLYKKIDLFKRDWSGSLSDTAIQPVMIGSNERAKEVSEKLQKAGYDVRPILSPTVQVGSERLRISLHVHNSDEEITELAKYLHELV